jgi:NAD(P)-dependent dehydrogenase (short-subunit alcohol dehydrogenase family)
MSQAPKYAVVTGAAGGIGQAIVAEFANNGYTVIATDCVPEPVNLGAHHYVQADLAKTVEDEAYAQSIFSQINTWLGPHALNALINNAAVQILGGLDSLSRNDWQQTLNVNLVAPFIWTQALLPKLEQEQGSVVNISSIHAKLTKKNFVAYATSKAALSGMTRALAVDVGPRIRVNAIEPAAIETEMLKAGFNGHPDSYAVLKNCHPQQRIGLPVEISELVLYLASGKSSFQHGSIVEIGGGISSLLHDPI